jgi:iron complex transport system substrate-binding protein
VRLSIVDRVDVLVWDAVNSPPEWSTDIKDDPLYQKLTVAKQGRDVFVQDKVTLGAIAWSTVLSLPFAIDRLVPRLAAAVDGNPATRIGPGS